MPTHPLEDLTQWCLYCLNHHQHTHHHLLGQSSHNGMAPSYPSPLVGLSPTSPRFVALPFVYMLLPKKWAPWPQLPPNHSNHHIHLTNSSMLTNSCSFILTRACIGAEATHKLALCTMCSIVITRAEHHPIYGIWPYPYGANTAMGTPITVTIQWPEKS
jgi:hypothetical protein